jgi:hypothetical protein
MIAETKECLFWVAVLAAFLVAMMCGCQKPPCPCEPIPWPTIKPELPAPATSPTSPAQLERDGAAGGSFQIPAIPKACSPNGACPACQPPSADLDTGTPACDQNAGGCAGGNCGSGESSGRRGRRGR